MGAPSAEVTLSAEALQWLHVVCPSAAMYCVLDASPTGAVFSVTFGFSGFFLSFHVFPIFCFSFFIFWFFLGFFVSLVFFNFCLRQEHVCVVLSRGAQVSASAPQGAQEHSCASLGSTI